MAERRTPEDRIPPSDTGCLPQRRKSVVPRGWAKKVFMQLLDAYRPAANRFVVFQARMGCGGLGDRVIGMISAAVLAILTQRQFRVHWEEPFPIRLGWQPNNDALPWDSQDYDDLTFERLSLIDRAPAMRAWFRSADLVRELPDNIAIEANQHFFSHLFHNPHFADIVAAAGAEPVSLTVELLTALATPTPVLADQISAWREQMARRSILGLQIRTLRNFGESGAISQNDLQRHFDCARAIVAKNAIDCVFVASDDSTAIDGARDRFPDIEVQSVRGPILHLDRSIPSDSWPFLGLLLSLHAVAACQELVISHWSNFGRLAVFMANRSPWITRKDTPGCPFPQVVEDFRVADLSELLSKDERYPFV